MTWQWAVSLALQGVSITALVNRSDPTSPVDPRNAPLPEGIAEGMEPKFIAVEPPVLSRRLPVVAYTAVDYQGWQKRALKRARELHAENPFDLVHHLSWASIHHGSKLNQLGPPFVLGPVGGGTMAAGSYRDSFSTSWRYERLRNIIVRLTPFSPPARKFIRSATLALASNRETQAILERISGHQVPIMLDDGVATEELMDQPASQSTSGPLRVLWVSRVMERKALGMALTAVEAAAPQCEITMTLMGDGEHRHVVDSQVDRMVGAGILADYGWTGPADLAQAYRTHDLLLFNSLRDNGSAPLHVASANGLPAVVINHQGPGIITNDDWAIRLTPASTEQTTADIAAALVALAADPERRVRMGKAALEAARGNTWPQRAQTMAAHYTAILQHLGSDTF